MQLLKIGGVSGIRSVRVVIKNIRFSGMVESVDFDKID